MNERRVLRQRCIAAYSSMAPGPLGGVPKEFRAQLHRLKTVVVDTPQLTNGAQTVRATWTLPGMIGDVSLIAHRATAGSSDTLLRGLHSATHSGHKLPPAPVHHSQPAIAWTAAHAGDIFELAVAGSVNDTLTYCDLTENERERIVVAARTLSRGGHVVYAIATGKEPHVEELRHGQLSFVGLVACSLELLPGTRRAIEQLRTRGSAIVYMSALPEDTATYIAHAAGITRHPKTARHGHYASDAEHAIYASVTRVSARRLLAALPQPQLVARHPLAQFVDMVDACR